MPLSAFEISSAIASTIAPTITSRAPTKRAEDQTMTPATISSAAGRMPKQADRAADRDVAGDLLSPALAEDRGGALQRRRGPVPSIAITGTARKVTRAQAMPTRRAAIWPPIPPWFSSRPITTLIAV